MRELELGEQFVDCRLFNCIFYKVITGNMNKEIGKGKNFTDSDEGEWSVYLEDIASNLP